MMAATEDAVDDVTNEVEFLTVEKIIDKCVVKNEVQYFIKWKGYPDADNAWVPVTNLNCLDMIEEFENDLKKKEEEERIIKIEIVPFEYKCVDEEKTIESEVPSYRTSKQNVCTSRETQPGLNEMQTDVVGNSSSEQRTSIDHSSTECLDCPTGTRAVPHNLLCRNNKSAKYQCKLCDRKFVRGSRLKEHMFLHTGEKPYKCSECTFGCGTYSGLKLHTETKHKVQEYMCESCGQVFLHYTRLRKHFQNRHNNVGVFKCRHCGMEFSIISKYEYHRRYAHRSAELVFECDDCGKKCNRRYNLLVHIRGVHLRATKRETCSICHISTTNIKKHMVTHTRERKFPCSLCKRRFMYKYDLAKHMKSSIHQN